MKSESEVTQSCPPLSDPIECSLPAPPSMGFSRQEYWSGVPCSSFILLQVVDQFSQHHLLKRLSFLHCIFLPPLSKTRCPYVHGFISGLSILFHWSYFCLCASTILFWWLWLCSIAWSQAGWFLQFHSSFLRLLWLFEVFCIFIQIVRLFVLALWKDHIAHVWSLYWRRLWKLARRSSDKLKTWP